MSDSNFISLYQIKILRITRKAHFEYTVYGFYDLGKEIKPHST